MVDVTARVNDEPNESVRELNGKEASATATPTTITSPLATLFVKETDSVLEQLKHATLFCCTSADAAWTGNLATVSRSVAEATTSMKAIRFLSIRNASRSEQASRKQIAFLPH